MTAKKRAVPRSPKCRPFLSSPQTKMQPVWRLLEDHFFLWKGASVRFLLFASHWPRKRSAFLLDANHLPTGAKWMARKGGPLRSNIEPQKRQVAEETPFKIGPPFLVSCRGVSISGLTPRFTTPGWTSSGTSTPTWRSCWPTMLGISDVCLICGSKPMGSHFGVPILVYFSGDWDVYWAGGTGF